MNASINQHSENEPKKERKWVKTAKAIVAFSGWVVAACSVLIPDQIEFITKAVIEAAKVLLNSM
jgi:hypothetical protein